MIDLFDERSLNFKIRAALNDIPLYKPVQHLVGEGLRTTLFDGG